MFIVLSFSVSKPSVGQDSNRNSVRASISNGNWYLVWGETINEAEYAKFTVAIAASVACECTAPVQGYFEDYYSRTVVKVKRNAPEVGQRVLEDLISQAFNDPGRIFSYRGVKVAAGVATYNRWNRVVYDEPYTYRCRWEGPLGSWTWGVCNGMKRKERRVPLPNWHQPYIKFKFISSSNRPPISNRTIGFYNQAAPGKNDYLNVVDFRVSPESSTSWGPNRISSPVANRSSQRNITIKNGSCLHDVRATFSDGHVNIGKIDFCEILRDGKQKDFIFLNYNDMF